MALLGSLCTPNGLLTSWPCDFIDYVNLSSARSGTRPGVQVEAASRQSSVRDRQGGWETRREKSEPHLIPRDTLRHVRTNLSRLTQGRRDGDRTN